MTSVFAAYRSVVPAVDVFGRNRFEFRDKPFDVDRVSVVGETLGPRVKYSEIRLCIGASGRGPLPTTIVGRGVVIDQMLGEMAFSLSPIDTKVFGQERGHDHPGTVVHPTGGEELAHCGVDEGESGGAGGPACEGFAGRRRPGHRCHPQ